MRYPTKAEQRVPVIVWHLTGSCNLSCLHCYACPDSGNHTPLKLDKTETRELLRAIAKLRPPALLLSGGEPLCHPDFSNILSEAHDLGLKVTVSTNGTLIGEKEASLLAKCASYAGISVDGPREIHDFFRGRPGAFEASSRAFKILAAAGCRTGFRVTLASQVIKHLGEIFEIAEKISPARVCFYHFMPSGKGAADQSLLPGESEENEALRRIIEWADKLANTALNPASREILTVGGASDCVEVLRYIESSYPERVAASLGLFKRASGKPAGSGILSIRWDGTVFRNQFSWNKPLGNWRNLESIIADTGCSYELAEECKPCREMDIRCHGRLRGFGRKCKNK